VKFEQVLAEEPGTAVGVIAVAPETAMEMIGPIDEIVVVVVARKLAARKVAARKVAAVEKNSVVGFQRDAGIVADSDSWLIVDYLVVLVWTAAAAGRE
jgi:uncharacterized ferredoxin-like protein